MTTFENMGDDNTLERQLSSLFRAEAEQAHLPPGTWQSIASKMGEPDTPFVLRRLLNAMSLPVRWRNPMELKYVATAVTVFFAVAVGILYLVLINPDRESPVPPTAIAGSPTVGPGPTPTVGPESTSEPVTNEKPFPDALKSGSPELPGDQVVALWTAYLSDTVIAGENKRLVELRLCGDSTGNLKRIHVENPPNPGVLESSPILTWNLETTSGAWNEVRVNYGVDPSGAGSDPQIAWDFQVFGHEDGELVGELYESLSIVEAGDGACSSS